jgi:hypothetical protein
MIKIKMNHQNHKLIFINKKIKKKKKKGLWQKKIYIYNVHTKSLKWINTSQTGRVFFFLMMIAVEKNGYKPT